MPAPLWLVAKVALLLAGLFLPGAALLRVLRIPRSVATCFAGSVVVLYATVLVLQFTSIPIHLMSLAGGLFLFTLVIHRVGAGAAAETSIRPSPLARQGSRNILSHMGAWTPLYLLVWVAIILRAWHQPLAGPDIEFRWSFLAEQMLRLGTLDFYPPRAAADFFHYFWVESIPPGASALHLWAFACGNTPDAVWTLPTLILQVWSLHELVWRTADRFAGLRAARFACLALAACPLLTWSTLLGQETGLTALSLAGIAFALLEWQRTGVRGWAALAGLFATIGAAAREYGLIFPVLAAVGLLAGCADRRTWLTFAATAALGFVWPLRCFVLTGNPFYSLGLGGAFPVNDRFVAWIENDAVVLGSVLQSGKGWQDIARYFLWYAPAVVLGWIWLGQAALRGSRAALWGLGAVVIVVGVWAASVRYTNGGLFYSMRVLSPALTLGAVAAGIALASPPWTRRGFAFMASVLWVVLVLFTFLPTLALPQRFSRLPWRDWPAFVSPPNPSAEPDPTVALVLQAMATNPGGARGLILADAPGYQRRFASTGIQVIPLWSPQADCLFDFTLSPAKVAQQWRESGIAYLIITKWQINLDFFNHRSRWSRPPLQPQLVGETKETWIFSVQIEK